LLIFYFFFFFSPPPYQSNITSGHLSGSAMRCPLASVATDSGGHQTPQGSTANELEKSEVEQLILLTARVGRNIDAEEQKQARAKAEKELAARRSEEELAEKHRMVNQIAEDMVKALGTGFCKKVRIHK
jgi:hypothetical protein